VTDRGTLLNHTWQKRRASVGIPKKHFPSTLERYARMQLKGDTVGGDQIIQNSIYSSQ
jgi:hypothetical protein